MRDTFAITSYNSRQQIWCIITQPPKMKKKLFLCFCLFSVFAFGQYNMLRRDTFEPVVVEGETVSAYGWVFHDSIREALSGNGYLDGRKCFRIEVSEGRLLLHFTDGAGVPEGYWGMGNLWSSSPSWARNGSVPVFPAPAFRIQCKVLVTDGVLRCPGNQQVKPSPQWQSLDYELKAPEKLGSVLFQFRKCKGMTLGLADVRIEPVYPADRGFISLPGGGRLERILIPQGCDDTYRLAALTWRGWLWRLSGVALPIETRADASPEKGAFLLKLGKVSPGGFRLKTDSDGMLLECNISDDFYSALFEHLRSYGVRQYSIDCQEVPDQDPNFTLKSGVQETHPKFAFIDCYVNAGLFAGSAPGAEYFVGSSCDWYDSARDVAGHNWCNLLVPYELYGKNHPEYYMLQEDGKRQHPTNPFFFTYCLTNPELLPIAKRRFPSLRKSIDYGRAPSICLGDRPTNCVCEACQKASDGKAVTDMMLGFINELASTTPNQQLTYCAYQNYRFPPVSTKPAPNLVLEDCIGVRTMPCMVHEDCILNKRGRDDAARWSQLFGKERFGFSFYEESRPFHDVRLLEYYGSLGSYCMHFFSFESEERSYVANRWRLGEDAEQAQREFDLGFYGPGGKYMTELYRMVDDFCRDYQHTEVELNGGTSCVAVLSQRTLVWKSILDRKMFDEAYRLFDKALALSGDNPAWKANITYDKYKFLLNDLGKYPRSSARTNEEMVAFSRRLADFIQLFPTVEDCKRPVYNRSKLMNTEEPDKFLHIVSGMKISVGKGKWYDAPELKQFLQDPDNAFIGSNSAKRIPGGMEMDALGFMGGTGVLSYSYNLKRRYALSFIKRASSGNGVIDAHFDLKTAPTHHQFVMVEGVDDDKPGAATYQVLVNGRELFSGINTFPEDECGWMLFDVPPDYFKAGDNTVTLVNTVPDKKERLMVVAQKGIDLGTAVVQDYTYDWIGINRIAILSPGEDFARLAHGQEAAFEPQKLPPWAKPLGDFEAQDGVYHLLGKGAKMTGCLFNTGKDAFLFAPKGTLFKVTVTARGRGKLKVAFRCLDSDGKNTVTYSSAKPLTAEEKPLVYLLAIRDGDSCFRPFFLVENEDEAFISDLNMEIEHGK